ncbi:PAS domain-containing sensor histidine kinase [Chryseotalea sanaruensis]|uniref:histidine kinase n=1 Tax=Chryseotalea sanaruensis TaxID=2482724 RepID=A0A401U508_9BACT|nr:PAS domain-containing sensor histidine kinase [Chryseotalea sanaruensis]GCC50054.1 PAS domain-containing sensor histidine kinase [Chryseotalea sanaruensis]
MASKDFKYERFFDLTPDLLCIAGFDGYFKRVNPAVPQLLGYSLEELYSRPVNTFIYEEDRDITSRVRLELTKAKPVHNFENRYVTKSGEIVWLYWTSLPVESDKLVFAIAKNITHKKNLEAERNALLASLTETNKDLKRLTFTVSHDLRSPVNNLVSLFSLIDNSKISDQETLELIEVVKLTGDKLKQTMNKYIDVLSDRHIVHNNFAEVSFQDSLDYVHQSISALIKVSKAVIQSDFSDLAFVKFNKAYMDSIFLNLITNSIKYARPDEVPMISIISKQNSGSKKLIFTDNGRGFDMEKVNDKIFGLHQTFHDYTDSKGIGLYLVHNHVSSLGGKIHVDSVIDKGATFTITFRD